MIYPHKENNEHSLIGYKLDGTQINLAEMSEITNPKRRESLIPFHNRNISWNNIGNWNGFLSSLMLKRHIDLPILSVYLSILLTTVPSAFGLIFFDINNIVSNNILHLWGIIHLLVTLFGQAQGFILGLHYSSHVRIWKKGWEWMDIIIHNLYCALFGIPSGAYYYHHIIMHHKEDNQLNYDASTTMPYQRDNKLHLISYILRYLVCIWVELPLILILRKRYLETFKLIISSVTYLIIIFYGMCICPLTTSYVFLLPYLIISFALMRGNQLQHLFVSPDDPTCDYKLSYNVCNTSTNELSFNDGFHIEHHINPNTHWADLPHKFLNMLPMHKKYDSFIFTGIDPDEIHYLVYSGKLHKLADYYVNIGQPSGKNKSILVEEMKRRLSPIYTYHRSLHKAK